VVEPFGVRRCRVRIVLPRALSNKEHECGQKAYKHGQRENNDNAFDIKRSFVIGENAQTRAEPCPYRAPQGLTRSGLGLTVIGILVGLTQVYL